MAQILGMDSKPIRSGVNHPKIISLGNTPAQPILSERQELLVDLIHRMMVGTQLFVETGMTSDSEGKAILGFIPRYIYKDMMEGSRGNPEELVMTGYVPEDKYLAKDEDIEYMAHIFVRNTVIKYLQGNRELLYEHKPKEELNDPIQRPEVAEGTSEQGNGISPDSENSGSETPDNS